MPEIHEYREVREVPVDRPLTREVVIRRSSPGALFLMFLLGLVCAAAIAYGIATAMGVQTARHPLRVSWPSGQVQVSRQTSPHVIFQRGQAVTLPPRGQS
jgi:hypothetical protein